MVTNIYVKETNMNELITTIPKNWKDIKLSTYVDLINTLPAEKPEDQSDDDFLAELLETFFYFFTNTTLKDANLTASETLQVINRLNSFQDKPEAFDDATGKIKAIEDISYSEYISFMKLNENPIQNMGAIIQLFHKEPIDVDNLSVEDAYGFFLAIRKGLKKYLTSSQTYSTVKKTMFQVVKVLFLKTIGYLKKRFKTGGVG